MPKPALSPVHWPFEQPHLLLALKQREYATEQERLKTSTSIRDIEFQDSDDEGTGYSPSEDSDDEEEEEAGSSQDMTGPIPMDLDVDKEEVQDLARDLEENLWPTSPTPSEKVRIKEEEFRGQMDMLDKSEKEAAAAYDPDEVVALLTEFYELLVQIAHWPLGAVQKAPHTNPKINAELGKELGYDETVLELMEEIPYVTNEASQHKRIIPDSFFYNYTNERDMRRAKKHSGYDMYEAPIDSWILPLAGASNRDGWSVVLDTRLGVIRSYMPINGLPKQSIEYRRHGTQDGGEDVPLEYHRAPLVPAAKYLSTLIECYRSLDRVPLMDAYHSDPEFSKDKHPHSLNWYFENIQDEQSSILALYKECGWPDNWDRPSFVEKWKVLEQQLQQRGRERMKRDGH